MTVKQYFTAKHHRTEKPMALLIKWTAQIEIVRAEKARCQHKRK
jgi:hypothetical protein